MEVKTRIGPALVATAIILALVVLLLSFSARADVGVNVYGLSYHPDKEEAARLEVDNQINPGIGLRYIKRGSYDLFADVGFYRDSGRNLAKLAAGGVFLKSGGFRFGGALAVMQSETYMKGDVFVAPIPLAGYDFGSVMVNLTYFPKVGGNVEAFGTWLTVWMR